MHDGHSLYGVVLIIALAVSDGVTKAELAGLLSEKRAADACRAVAACAAALHGVAIADGIDLQLSGERIGRCHAQIGGSYVVQVSLRIKTCSVAEHLVALVRSET